MDMECSPGRKRSTSDGYRGTTCEKGIFSDVVAPSDGSSISGTGFFRDYENTNECLPCRPGMIKEVMFQCNSSITIASLIVKIFWNRGGARNVGWTTGDWNWGVSV